MVEIGQGVKDGFNMCDSTDFSIQTEASSVAVWLTIVSCFSVYMYY